MELQALGRHVQDVQPLDQHRVGCLQGFLTRLENWIGVIQQIAVRNPVHAMALDLDRALEAEPRGQFGDEGLIAHVVQVVELAVLHDFRISWA